MGCFMVLIVEMNGLRLSKNQTRRIRSSVRDTAHVLEKNFELPAAYLGSSSSSSGGLTLSTKAAVTAYWVDQLHRCKWLR